MAVARQLVQLVAYVFFFFSSLLSGLVAALSACFVLALFPVPLGGDAALSQLPSLKRAWLQALDFNDFAAGRTKHEAGVRGLGA